MGRCVLGVPPPRVPTLQGQEKLNCNPKKENGSHIVLCELGNPMKAGARVRCPLWAHRPGIRAGQGCWGWCWVTHLPTSLQITVGMELSVSGLEDMGDAITFHLQLRR